MLNLCLMIKARLSGLLQREQGQSMTEYALILALIAIVVIAIMTTMGDTIEAVFTSINNSLDAILNPAP